MLSEKKASHKRLYIVVFFFKLKKSGTEQYAVKSTYWLNKIFF